MPLRVLGKVKLSRCVSFTHVCVCVCAFFYIAVIVVISLYLIQFSSKEFTIRGGYKLELTCRGTGTLVIMPLDSQFIPQSMFLCDSGKRRFYGWKENVHRCLEKVLAGSRQFQEKASMPFGVWLGGERAQYSRQDKGYSSLSC